jgi:hypothetical protein
MLASIHHVNPLFVYVIVAIVFAGWAIPVVGSELRRMRGRRRGNHDARRLQQYRRPGKR